MYLKIEKTTDTQYGESLAIVMLSAGSTPITPPQNSPRFRQIGKFMLEIQNIAREDQAQAKLTYRELIKYVSDENLELASHAFLRAMQLSQEEDQRRDQIIPALARTMLCLEGEARDTFKEAADTIERYVTEFLQGLEYFAFLYPTDCLEIQARERIFLHLSSERTAKSKSRQTQNMNHRAVFDARWTLCDQTLDEVGTNIPEKLATLLKTTIIDMLPTSMLPDLARSIREIAGSSGKYDAHLDYLDTNKVNVEWYHAAVAFGQALIDLTTLELEGFKARVDDLMADAREQYNNYYAMLLRYVHRDIRANLPTQAIATAQNKILTEFRAKVDLSEYQTAFALIERDIQEETEKRALEEQIARENMEALLRNYVEPKSDIPQKSKKKTPSRKKSKRTPKTEPKNEVSTTNIRIERNDQEQDLRRLVNFLRFTQLDFRDLQREIEQLPVSEPEDAITIARSELLALILQVSSTLAETLGNSKLDVSEGKGIANSIAQTYKTARQRLEAINKVTEGGKSFEKALLRATNAERASLNRRQGGQIRSKGIRPSWNEIWSRYHKKAITTVSEIIIGNQKRLLCENEALAYYVTRSSQSGFDFDISAHYWVRREGHTGDAVDENGYMNDADWYDTYIPCFVLHVPMI